MLVCEMVHPEFNTALFVFEAVVLMMGARLCWAVKDVPGEWTHYFFLLVFFGMYFIIITVTMLFAHSL